MSRPIVSVSPGTIRNAPVPASTNWPPSGSWPLGGISIARGSPTISVLSSVAGGVSLPGRAYITASSITSAVTTISTGIA